MQLSAARKKAITYGLFLALPVLLFCISYIFAIGYTVDLSFFEWDGISPHRTFVGLENYVTLFEQDRFRHAVWNNVLWLGFFLVCPTVLGLALALLVDGLKGEAVYKLTIFIPYVLTPVAIAAIWRWLYQPRGGFFNEALAAVGLGGWAQNWLGDADVVNGAVMLAALWCMTGFSFLVFYSGLRAIPYEYIEAARIDGARPTVIFFRIVLPQLWPSTILVLGIFGIDAMRVFDIVWATSGGGPARASEVLSTQLYDVAFETFKMGMASAIGVIQFALAAVLILPYIVYIAMRVEDQTE